MSDARSKQFTPTRRTQQKQRTEQASSPPEFDVSRLVGDQREAWLIHDGERYRLRITANNKLILTK